MQAREYKSADDMLKHYAALRAKFRPAPRPVVIPRPFIRIRPADVPPPSQALVRDMGEIHTVRRPKWISEALKHDCRAVAKIPYQMLPKIIHPHPECNRPIRAEIERIMAKDQVNWGMIVSRSNSSYLAKVRRKVVLVMRGFGMTVRYIAGQVFGRTDHSGVFKILKGYPIPVGVPDGGVAGVYPVLHDPSIKPRKRRVTKTSLRIAEAAARGAPTWCADRVRGPIDPLDVKREEMCPAINGNPELWAKLVEITERTQVHRGLIRSLSGHKRAIAARYECITAMRQHMTVQEICAAINRSTRAIRGALAAPLTCFTKADP